MGAIGLDNLRLRQQVNGLQAHVGKQQDVIAMLQQPKTRLVSLKRHGSGRRCLRQHCGDSRRTQSCLGAAKPASTLSAGQYYQLWAVVNGQKLPWERFNANDRGNVFTKLSLPENQITTLVVTVETVLEPKNPTGPMVMSSDS